MVAINHTWLFTFNYEIKTEILNPLVAIVTFQELTGYIWLEDTILVSMIRVFLAS